MNHQSFSDEHFAQCMGLMGYEAQAYGVSLPELQKEVSKKLGCMIEDSQMHAFMPDRKDVDYQCGQSYIPALPQVNYRVVPTSNTYTHDGSGNVVLRQFNYLHPQKLEFKNTSLHIRDVINALKCSASALENTLQTMKNREVWTLDKNIADTNLLNEAKNIFEAVINNIIENNAECDLTAFLKLHDDNIGHFLLFVAYLPADDFLFLNNYLYAYDAKATVGMMETAMSTYASYLTKVADGDLSQQEIERLSAFMNAITSYFERMHFLNRCFIKESIYSRENMQRVQQIINTIQLKTNV